MTVSTLRHAAYAVSEDLAIDPSATNPHPSRYSCHFRPDWRLNCNETNVIVGVTMAELLPEKLRTIGNGNYLNYDISLRLLNSGSRMSVMVVNCRGDRQFFWYDNGVTNESYSIHRNEMGESWQNHCS